MVEEGVTDSGIGWSGEGWRPYRDGRVEVERGGGSRVEEGVTGGGFLVERGGLAAMAGQRCWGEWGGGTSTVGQWP